MEKTYKEILGFTAFHMFLLTISWLLVIISGAIMGIDEIGISAGLWAITYTFILSILRFLAGTNKE
jgi:uncharacterized Tic20 family protein